MSGRIGNPEGHREMLRRVRAALYPEGELSPGEPPAPPPIDDRLARLVEPGPALAELFAARAAESGMHVHTCDPAGLSRTIAGILRSEGVRSFCAAVAPGGAADAVLAAARDAGAAHVDHRSQPGLGAQFEVDAGITDIDAAIAETGSIVVRSDPQHARGAFVVPPVHIAIVPASCIVPDLLDCFRGLSSMPTSLVLVSGPSKTADIEGILITGVHGPRAVHAVVVQGP